MVFPGRVDDPRTRQRLRGRHSLPHQTAGGADAALMLREARPDHALIDDSGRIRAGLGPKTVAARIEPFTQVLISRTLSVSGEVAERLKAAVC